MYVILSFFRNINSLWDFIEIKVWVQIENLPWIQGASFVSVGALLSEHLQLACIEARPSGYADVEDLIAVSSPGNVWLAELRVAEEVGAKGEGWLVVERLCGDDQNEEREIETHLVFKFIENQSNDLIYNVEYSNLFKLKNMIRIKNILFHITVLSSVFYHFVEAFYRDTHPHVTSDILSFIHLYFIIFSTI